MWYFATMKYTSCVHDGLTLLLAQILYYYSLGSQRSIGTTQQPYMYTLH